MTEESKTKLREKILRSKELTAMEKRYLEGLVNASDWIPCSERMPGRFDTVLLAILSKNGYGEPAYYVTIGGMKNGNEFESYTGDICECETVTHWMLFPEPPQKKDMSGGSA